MKQKVLKYDEAFPVKDLKPFPKNPRKHTQEQIDFLVKNIERFGFLDPILVQKSTNYIVCGHARLKALIKLGETHADVFVWDVSNEDAMAHMIASNKSSTMSTWDIPFLKDCLAELEGRSYPMPYTGFSDVNVDCLFDHESKEKPKDDFKDMGLTNGNPKGTRESPDQTKLALWCTDEEKEKIVKGLQDYCTKWGIDGPVNAILDMLKTHA